MTTTADLNAPATETKSVTGGELFVRWRLSVDVNLGLTARPLLSKAADRRRGDVAGPRNSLQAEVVPGLT